jgi:ribosome assembly protein 1
MRQKETLIASAKAEGKTTDEAVASTEDAVARDRLAAIDAEQPSEVPDQAEQAEKKRSDLRLLKDFETSIEAGFGMATFQGPLCSEPVVGMAWTVESVEYHKPEEETEGGEL